VSIASGQAVTRIFTTAHPATKAPTDADATPTGTLYVNGTADAATVTVTNITTGVYKAAVTLPALSVGDDVDMRIAATVATVAGTAVIWADTCDHAQDDVLTPLAVVGGNVGSILLDTGTDGVVVAAASRTLIAEAVRDLATSGLAALKALIDQALTLLGLIPTDDTPAGYTRITSATYGTLLPGTVIDAYAPTDTTYATPLVPNVTVASNGSWYIDLPDAATYVLVARLAHKDDVTQEVIVP